MFTHMPRAGAQLSAKHSFASIIREFNLAFIECFENMAITFQLRIGLFALYYIKGNTVCLYNVIGLRFPVTKGNCISGYIKLGHILTSSRKTAELRSDMSLAIFYILSLGL